VYLLFFKLPASGGPISAGIFFNWYYWCINVGTLVALSGVAYLQQNYSIGGSPLDGFFWGYIAGIASLVFALLVFLTGML